MKLAEGGTGERARALPSPSFPSASSPLGTVSPRLASLEVFPLCHIPYRSLFTGYFKKVVVVVAVVVFVCRKRGLGWLIDGTTDPSLDSD